MSFLITISRSSIRQAFSPCLARSYAAKSSNTEQTQKISTKDTSFTEEKTLSSCPPGTILEGLNYLKGQPPVIALPDEEYPSWLWELLKPKAYEEDGPGGKAEKKTTPKGESTTHQGPKLHEDAVVSTFAIRA
ncbi:mitochondrial ribosomal protein L37-domain-containing protein [Suillus subalutaceus]|uniref:mitochondrial ribosomal protein L37-domain-containing protein n=1 Tax=Suillus subalutaceus TaxID=48586 RepID=UPI001B87FB5D|nr:mitochondrial ribosomal protein L37-domain-containing protein [Suillus subalutaceus]KAG1863617.1 mitochondrial ribosomal protein L37-domain-containing protein [Suillus subalutaceus]